MRFQTSRTLPTLWNGRDRRRLWTLMWMFIALIVGLNFARDKRNWKWLDDEPAPRATAARQRPVLERTNSDENELPPDGFRVEQGSSKSPSPIPLTPLQRDPQNPTALDPAWLADVHDNSLNLPKQEAVGYFRILEQARQLPQQELETAAIENLTYEQIFGDPDVYRGRLVTLSGTLRQLVKFPVGANEFGVTHLYEAWFFTQDSGVNPFVLHCLSVPKGIPLGMKLTEKVRITGYFFKLYAYDTKGGLYSAPLLLGKTVRWSPAAVPTPKTPESVSLLLLGLCTLGVLLGGFVWWFTAHETNLQKQRLQQSIQTDRDNITALAGIEPVTIQESLRRLADAEMADLSTQPVDPSAGRH